MCLKPGLLRLIQASSAGVEMNRGRLVYPVVIYAGQIPEMTGIQLNQEDGGGSLVVGGAATLSCLEEKLPDFTKAVNGTWADWTIKLTACRALSFYVGIVLVQFYAVQLTFSAVLSLSTA